MVAGTAGSCSWGSWRATSTAAPSTATSVSPAVAATTRPWLFYFPGLVINIIALTINFVGDGLRDAFDPTQTRVRA